MSERDSLPRHSDRALDVDAVARGLAEMEQAIAERDRYRAALETIRDHGTVNGHKCWALHQGDCADVFQETARAALDG